MYCCEKDARKVLHFLNYAMTMNSFACHGVTGVFLDHKLNITPMCSGSYTAGP
jgi:hypothetical protein